MSIKIMYIVEMKGKGEYKEQNLVIEKEQNSD